MEYNLIVGIFSRNQFFIIKATFLIRFPELIPVGMFSYAYKFVVFKRDIGLCARPTVIPRVFYSFNGGGNGIPPI